MQNFRPGGASELGKYLDYPADAAGSVDPYWLASSPGSGHRVRMTGACKRALLATIEAVIERAVVPCTFGNIPAAGFDFKGTSLDSIGTPLLVSLGPLSGVAYRAALGSKLVRGCPKDEWGNLVTCVKRLWQNPTFQTRVGNVMAWQVEMIEFDTGGFIGEVDGHLDITGMNQVLDLVAYYADEHSILGSYPDSTPILRPWGDFPGGNMTTNVSDWVVNSLTQLGANTDTGSANAISFSDEQLIGSPRPLAAGHEGNWFGSSASTMVGQAVSARRSSSAWAVLQAMLANMKYSHLAFPYEHFYHINKTKRKILRYVTMDEDSGEIQTVEVYDIRETEYIGESTDVCASSGSDFSAQGLATRPVKFVCAGGDVEDLVVFVRPATGWKKVGEDLLPYLSFGSVSDTAGAVLELSVEATTGISRIIAGTQSEGITYDSYPAASMREYIAEYGRVEFVDCETYSDMSSMSAAWTKWSVRKESGDYDLKASVRNHASWLLTQIPTIEMPPVQNNPGTLHNITRLFWDGWEVQYPDQPNIQINGQDAYFPVAFRNNSVVSMSSIPITLVNGEWVSGDGYECIFGIGRMAFPGIDEVMQFGGKSYRIFSRGEAIAGYKWNFKAMST